MTYAIPLYLYIEANSEQEAKAIKANVEKMLNNPLVAGAMQQARIPQRGFRVLEPLIPG